MPDLEATSIYGLPPRVKADVVDTTDAWIPYEDVSGDPVDTFRMSIADLVSGVLSGIGIAFNQTDIPATTDAVGLYMVQTGANKGLYINTGTEVILVTPYTIDGNWPVS